MGVKRKSEEEEVQGEILTGGSEEVAENGYGTSRSVGSACSGDGPNRKIKIEDGSSSREEGVNFALPFSWKRLALKWKKSTPPQPLRLGQKEFGMATGAQNIKKHG